MQYNSINTDLSFFQKIINFDYILLSCILVARANTRMYSTDSGELLFHTKSHVIKFLFFIPMMIILSFFNIRFWHFIS